MQKVIPIDMSFFISVYQFLFPRYSYLATPFLIIVFFFILEKVYYHDVKKTILYTAFALYMVIIYRICGLPDALHFTFRPRIQLIPFYDFIDDLFNGCLNVFLFIPFGFFLPALWRDFFSCKNTLLTAAGFSFFIEFMQIFCPRLTDINDIMTNTFGAFLGFCLLRVFTKSQPSLFQSGFKKRECFLFFGTTFSLLFFVNPVVVRFLQQIRLLIANLS